MADNAGWVGGAAPARRRGRLSCAAAAAELRLRRRTARSHSRAGRDGRAGTGRFKSFDAEVDFDPARPEAAHRAEHRAGERRHRHRLTPRPSSPSRAGSTRAGSGRDLRRRRGAPGRHRSAWTSRVKLTLRARRELVVPVSRRNASRTIASGSLLRRLPTGASATATERPVARRRRGAGALPLTLAPAAGARRRSWRSAALARAPAAVAMLAALPALAADYALDPTHTRSPSRRRTSAPRPAAAASSASPAASRSTAPGAPAASRSRSRRPRSAPACPRSTAACAALIPRRGDASDRHLRRREAGLRRRRSERRGQGRRGARPVHAARQRRCR